MIAPSGKADWQAIRRDLLARIQTGAWKPGDQIPREVELAAVYNCTRSTVGRALRDLATAGFLERKRKGGTTVSPNPMRKAPLDVPIIAEAIRKAGHKASYQLLGTAEQQLDPARAAELGLPANTPLLFIAALYLADGAPFQVEHRWLLPTTVVGLTPAILQTTPVDEWLLHNLPLSRAQISIEAVTAPQDVSVALRIAPDTPSLLITRTSWRQTHLIGLLRLYHSPGYSLLTAI